MRKRAGKVRDMDVLAGHLAETHMDTDRARSFSCWHEMQPRDEAGAAWTVSFPGAPACA